MVEWILEDIGHQIDPKQFGSLCGSSITLCLLDMFHSRLIIQLDADGRPILFLLMVNDLKTLESDLTISEVIKKYSQSNMQQELDCISNWCDQNYMQLNPEKCKELIFNFRRDFPKSPLLTIDQTTLETVSSRKLLRYQFQNELK